MLVEKRVHQAVMTYLKQFSQARTWEQQEQESLHRDLSARIILQIAYLTHELDLGCNEPNYPVSHDDAVKQACVDQINDLYSALLKRTMLSQESLLGALWMAYYNDLTHRYNVVEVSARCIDSRWNNIITFFEALEIISDEDHYESINLRKLSRLGLNQLEEENCRLVLSEAIIHWETTPFYEYLYKKFRSLASQGMFVPYHLMSSLFLDHPHTIDNDVRALLSEQEFKVVSELTTSFARRKDCFKAILHKNNIPGDLQQMATSLVDLADQSTQLVLILV